MKSDIFIQLLALLFHPQTILLFFDILYHRHALTAIKNTRMSPYILPHLSFVHSNALNATIFTLPVYQSHPQATFAPVLT